ncbi:hypothetical protein NG99_27205 [Erwinia typographi]|uniref:Tail spike TSP1/Gp66 N-terminal domain-containing protein n=1 Tax=Erwinia typographi TaxID=371042 RepID=A0A0A3YHC6_9GAMM|nr:hypothetical protein [Erwinia typographi]KGT86000.1 hypothetical protein NG99_27205 [Erwinia typographi]
MAVTVDTFASLRQQSPSEEGEVVWLAGHTTAPYGEGAFIGHLSAGADDGGFIAAGDGFYWQRITDLNDLTVCDFGAIPDGVTDCSPAATAQLEFMMSDSAVSIAGVSTIRQAGIKFPAGTFYMTPVNWMEYGTALAETDADYPYYTESHYSAFGGIRIQGFSTPYGKQVFTTIISDSSDGYVFKLNHRRLVVEGIKWNGQQSTGYDSSTMLLTGATQGVFNDTASNTQGFIYNDCAGGCYVYIKNFENANTGGHTFFIKDTLDSIVEQCYSSTNAAPFFTASWTNRPTGVWDHSTSIEFRNCNFLTNLAPCIWAPRAAQCKMDNVWFSGPGNVPFDINNAQFIINMMCIEGCVHNPVMYACRAITNVLSVPTGNDYDWNTLPSDDDWYSYPQNPDGSEITSWLSGYERGNVLVENHGIEISGTLKAKWQSGVLRGTNNSSSVLYLNIGSFTIPNTGGQWEIEVICRDGYSSVGSGNYAVTGDRTPGKTIINIQRGSGTTPIITYYHQGNSGVKGVQFTTPTYADTIPDMWIQLAAYCGEYVINAKSTGPTRFDAGTCALFTPSGTTQTTSPGLTFATARMSIHNGSAGVGAQGNIVAISTATNTPTDTTTVSGYMEVVLNGTIVFVPYYS